jgi:hypothetical protein
MIIVPRLKIVKLVSRIVVNVFLLVVMESVMLRKTVIPVQQNVENALQVVVILSVFLNREKIAILVPRIAMVVPK